MIIEIWTNKQKRLIRIRAETLYWSEFISRKKLLRRVAQFEPIFSGSNVLRTLHRRNSRDGRKDLNARSTVNSPRCLARSAHGVCRLAYPICKLCFESVTWDTRCSGSYDEVRFLSCSACSPTSRWDQSPLCTWIIGCSTRKRRTVVATVGEGRPLLFEFMANTAYWGSVLQLGPCFV